jgi:hypothetical protein
MAVPGGCGRSEPGLVPVRGKVTLDGGTWPRQGFLTFTPEDGRPGAPNRPGSARFDSDGSFAVTSFEERDGLFPGTYHVSVECWETEPSMASNGMPIEGKSVVPKKYQSGLSSGLTLSVKPEARVIDATFDVRTK